MSSPVEESGKSCIFRITASDREKLEAVLFQRYPDAEWGTFFLFGYRVTPWGLHVTYVDMIEPSHQDLDAQSGIVEFNARYILRAQLTLESTQLGIGVIHSHPENCGTEPSSLDDDMDAYFSREFSECSGARPYLTLRVARERTGGFSFSGEAWMRTGVIAVRSLLTVGGDLHREEADSGWKRRSEQPKEDERRARFQELIGARAGQLRESTIGVIGCSGLGSPSVHVLVRAGVRRFVLVDPDFFAPSNLERMHGSSWQDVDVKPPKTEILRRLIHEVEPKADVVMICGNVLHDQVLDELLKCDLVLGCTDSQHSRAALGDFASHYLLPCLDAAVLMRAKNGKLTEQVGEIARYSPDEPCPWCLGRIDQKALTYELLTESEREQRARAAAEAVQCGIDGAQYWGGAPPRELTVGYITTIVGAMQAGYAEAWLTGSASMPHQRFQFDLGAPLLGAVAVEKHRNPQCSCNRTKGWADQARCDRSVTTPDCWAAPAIKQAERQREPPRSTS